MHGDGRLRVAGRDRRPERLTTDRHVHRPGMRRHRTGGERELLRHAVEPDRGLRHGHAVLRDHRRRQRASGRSSTTSSDPSPSPTPSPSPSPSPSSSPSPTPSPSGSPGRLPPRSPSPSRAHDARRCRCPRASRPGAELPFHGQPPRRRHRHLDGQLRVIGEGPAGRERRRHPGVRVGRNGQDRRRRCPPAAAAREVRDAHAVQREERVHHRRARGSASSRRDTTDVGDRLLPHLVGGGR